MKLETYFVLLLVYHLFHVRSWTIDIHSAKVGNEFIHDLNKKGHLKPIGESGTKKEIDQVDGFLDPHEFHNNYVRQSRPLLMKNAAKSIPAFHLWTDDYLKSKSPIDKSGEVFVEIGKKEKRNGGSAKMNIHNFLKYYNISDIYMVEDVPSFLQQDVIIPWSIQCKEYEKLMDKSVMWFSSGGTKSVLHSDDYENINCLYRGKKRIIFMDRHRYKDIYDLIIDRSDESYSSINVDSVDLEMYPFMADIEFHVGIMEAGDCLYIPIKWIHQVQSFQSNLAVNVWWMENFSENVSFCKKRFDKNMTLDKVEWQNTPADELEKPDEL